MKQEFLIEGMTCQNCVAKVRGALGAHLKDFDLGLEAPQLKVRDDEKISTTDLNQWLSPLKKYSAKTVSSENMKSFETPLQEQKKSFVITYKPVLLIFAYLLLGVGCVEWAARSFDSMRAMNHFMGGFFLVFSFFKLLDVSKFADAYSSYDILARRSRAYAVTYPFIELLLGFLYLAQISHLGLYAVTLLVMGLSLVGVLQGLLQKRAIQCACLGAVFDLPMSKLTLFEDALMIVMSAWMLWQHLA